MQVLVIDADAGTVVPCIVMGESGDRARVVTLADDGTYAFITFVDATRVAEPEDEDNDKFMKEWSTLETLITVDPVSWL